ncbi:MAG: hypothetical protein QOD66_808 [Solirubrobacteraceae bacterium]|jgi:hypothetical protein|nr:hypothetical protein [Solirubrobacteraceae bacterium]
MSASETKHAVNDRAGHIPARRPARPSLPVGAGGAPGSSRTRRRAPGRHWLLGGTEGNEILTSAAAVVLVGLLVAEGITIVRMRGLLSAHMFIGLVLIPPVLLKLGSTGYRMISYYGGSRAYRLSGPPRLPLRLMAPVLVASTIAVLASGVLLLAAGHKSNAVLTIHKLSFIVFGGVLAVHFLAYVPRMARSLRHDWGAARRDAVPGAGVRAMLVAAAVGGGAALALALLPTIHAYAGH